MAVHQITFIKNIRIALLHQAKSDVVQHPFLIVAKPDAHEKPTKQDSSRRMQ